MHEAQNLDNLPREFLESYPYPSFVLHIPIPISIPNSDSVDANGPEKNDLDGFTIDAPTSWAAAPQTIADLPFTRNYANSGVFDDLTGGGRSHGGGGGWRSFLDPIWSNSKWKNLVNQRHHRITSAPAPGSPRSGQGQGPKKMEQHSQTTASFSASAEEFQGDLLSLLDLDGARSFGNWVSGVTDFQRRQAKMEALEKNRKRKRRSKDVGVGVGIGVGIGDNSSIISPTNAVLSGNRKREGLEGVGKGDKEEKEEEEEDLDEREREKKTSRPAQRSSAPEIRNGVLAAAKVETSHQGFGSDLSIRHHAKAQHDKGMGMDMGTGMGMEMDVDVDVEGDGVRSPAHRANGDVWNLASRPDGAAKTDLAPTDASTTSNVEEGNEIEIDPWTDDIATSQPLLLYIKALDIWLELIKIPLAMSPADPRFSYMVIQSLPPLEHHLRSRHTSVHSLDVATPASELAKFSLSPKTATFPNPNPFSHGDSNVPPVSSLTPLVVKPRYTSPENGNAHPSANDSNDVSGYFPPAEPIVFGRDDVDQLTCFPRPSSSDPLSIEHLLQVTDWSKTPLGPRENWPQSLKSALSIVLSMPGQANLWWGKDLVQLYNDHYAAMLPGKHPQLFGSNGPISWSEIWAGLGPLADQVMSGTPITKEDDLFLFETWPEKKLEEVYFDWTWVPVRGEDGSVAGLLNYTKEMTKKVIAERRLKCTREVSDGIGAARNLGEFNRAVMDGLSGEEIAKDIPFAILYHCTIEDVQHDATVPTNLMKDDISTPSVTVPNIRVKLTLGDSMGVPKDHPLLPAEITVSINKPPRCLGGLNPATTSSPTMSLISALSNATEDDDASVVRPEEWPIKELLRSRKNIVVDDCSTLIDGFPIRSWGAPPEQACLVPICNESSSDLPTAVLIVGLNVRRKFDHEYQTWLHQLRQHLYGGLLQVRSMEAEREHAQELKAMDEMKSNWISGVSHELRLPLT